MNTHRARLIDEIYGRAAEDDFDTPVISADEWMGLIGYTPGEREQLFEAKKTPTPKERLYSKRDLLAAVRRLMPTIIEAYEDPDSEASIAYGDEIFDAISERGLVEIVPTKGIPGSFSLKVTLSPLHPYGPFVEFAGYSEADAIKVVLICVDSFLLENTGTTRPTSKQLKKLSRPHLTILGSMLQALVTRDVVWEQPGVRGAPAHTQALKMLANLRPYAFAGRDGG